MRQETLRLRNDLNITVSKWASLVVSNALTTVMRLFSGQQCSYSCKHIGTKMSYWQRSNYLENFYAVRYVRRQYLIIVLLKDSRCLLKIYDFKRTYLCYVLWTFTLIMVCFYIHLVGSGPCNILASLPTSKVILPTSTTAKLILTAQISELKCTALCFPNYHNDQTKHKYRSHWISEDKEHQNVQYNSLISAST